MSQANGYPLFSNVSGGTDILTDKSTDISSLAIPFDPEVACLVGKFYAYDHKIYKCLTYHLGVWNSNDFELQVLTNPDASIYTDDTTGDLMIIGSDNSILWSSNNVSRYKSVTSSGTTVSASSNSVIGIEASNSSTTTYAINLPSLLGGKINDFILDIHASGAGDIALTLNKLDTTFKVLTKFGVDLNTILTVTSGSYARFTITQSPLTSSNLPIYIIDRIDLELYSSISS